MEDLPKKSKEESLRSEEDDEFYEQIEAPKFVDLTAPDRSRPDDTSWFCVRIGCDQKHDQVDPDALYKSFVLRVMAARSPNLRLQRALTRRSPSVLEKCPRSAPAKSAKSRLSRLSVLATIPQKIGENKVKVSLLSKFKSIPSDGKVMQSSTTAKALTTSRHKKCQPNAEPFRSAQNPKALNVMPKNRMTAKALIFQTAKKSEKTSFNKRHDIPKMDICSEMNRPEISSQKQKAPRSFCKSSRCGACDSNHMRPALSPRKTQLWSRKLHKNRIEVPSKYLKKISKPNVKKCHSSAPQEGIDADSSDMEIDRNSRNGSLEVFRVSNGHVESLKDASSLTLEVMKTNDELLPSLEESSIEGNSIRKSGKDLKEDALDEVGVETKTMNELLPSLEESSIEGNSSPNSEKDLKENALDEVGVETKNMENSDKENATDNTSVGHTNMAEEFLPSSDEFSSRDNSISNSEMKVLQEKDHKIQNSSGEYCKINRTESADKENRMESLGRENAIEETTLGVLNGKIESVSTSDASNGVADVMEPVDIADKENASAFNGNRDMNLNIHHSERKMFQHRECEKPQKGNEVPVKILKENSVAAANGTQGGRLKKWKATNPKPFRLRTDERGILKEAKLERRIHLHDPQMEVTPVSNEMSLKRQHDRNEIHRNGRSNGQENSPCESNKTAPKTKTQQYRPTTYLKFSKDADPKLEIRTPQRQKSEDGMEKVNLKMLKTPKSSPSVKPRRELMSQGRLAVIKEKSTISRSKESPCEAQVKSCSATTTSRSSSRGKRPLTVLKEPSSHAIHVPKSCTSTKTRTNVIS